MSIFSSVIGHLGVVGELHGEAGGEVGHDGLRLIKPNNNDMMT